ncbi:Putative cation exchanger [Cladobotryum mycophilum]|uniref:Cation exchanger n=1 Tax=Cladobotryum mycophilum TaxID=491253 RepID=A0ABR0T169_9HYPO
MEPSKREDAPPPGQRSGASSGMTSPTDTRKPPALPKIPSAAVRDDNGLSESFQSTDTVRRRPEGYDTIPEIPETPTNPNMRGSQILGEASTDRQQSKSSTSAARSTSTAGLERAKSISRLRRPGLSRRTSATTPHRGEVFSVDDEAHEVVADAAVHRSGYSIRRRQPATNLVRIQSHRSVDGEHEPERDAAPSQLGDEDDEDEDDDDEEELPLDEHVDCESDGDISDAESFTLKDRQQAINQTHPFGIRVWKPALYKKDRSIQKFAQADIHSSPGGRVNSWLLLFNLVWTLVFGWWMAFVAALGAIICLLFAAGPSGREYGRVLWGLAGYLFYPFGKFVRLEKDETYLDEDQDEGRSISEYEQWQNGDLEYGRLFFGPDRNRSIIGRSRRSIDSEPSETDSLLGRGRHSETEMTPRMKRRLFGRGEWNIGRVVFFVFFYFLISPALIIVSGICWFLVFWIPMGKVTILLFTHLRRHPLALSFESHIGYAREEDAPDSSILVCTYRAVGSKYWKYTVDGTNIFLINLMVVVVVVIADWAILERILHVETFITEPAFLFTASLLSIIPLAYFIGQAVASISAQSSMGIGAAINALFATVVEVFLYCIALRQGKAQLVEGSVIGSIFAGILFLPGISMCFGALKRKTQRFNAKSAGVTSTMLLFAVVGAFGPTLFYQIYGTHEIKCVGCEDHRNPGYTMGRDCSRCYFSQTPELDDRFYLEAVRPYCYFAATMLFFSYLIGLWFTLRTHAAVIWNAEVEEKRHDDLGASTILRTSQPSVGDGATADIRDSRMYKRVLGQSLKQVGLPPRSEDISRQGSITATTAHDMTGANGQITPHVVPPKTLDDEHHHQFIKVPGLSQADNNMLVREVAEIAAAAATIASRDRFSHKPSGTVPVTPRPHVPSRTGGLPDIEEDVATAGANTAPAGGHGGHDAPNWSRMKSTVILLGATILYAIIAEILVDTVDVVLESFAIDQKFLGITLFALVPNTTEFLNAISFAMNGNIALSMEIGSAYALQVCLLQIPCLVLYSALYPNIPPGSEATDYTFSLLFPQWDMVTVILCVFLLSYVYSEGKSNYFKGSVLMLTYLVVVMGYYFSGFTVDYMGMHRFDTMGADGKYQSFKTVGRSTRGIAFEV